MSDKPKKKVRKIKKESEVEHEVEHEVEQTISNENIQNDFPVPNTPKQKKRKSSRKKISLVDDEDIVKEEKEEVEKLEYQIVDDETKEHQIVVEEKVKGETKKVRKRGRKQIVDQKEECDKAKKKKLEEDIKKDLEEDKVEEDVVEEKEEKKKLELKFLDYEKVPVSTKTFIISTNITFDIKNLFSHLPITDYIIIPKKRGRRKKVEISDPNSEIKEGSIITISMVNNHRGVLLKEKKKKQGKTINYFRNSLTIVMIMGGKKINFKITQNGKFQMTGCKTDAQAENCVKKIWEYTKDHPELYEFLTEDKVFSATFIPAMRNIDFQLGFSLNKERLDMFFNKHTEYRSMLETSMGYTGVSIKSVVTKPLENVPMKRLKYVDGVWSEPETVLYREYLDTMKPKEQEKKIAKLRCNTFLVFHSGKCIMTSMCDYFARENYYDFIEIVKNNYENFMEIT